MKKFAASTLLITIVLIVILCVGVVFDANYNKSNTVDNGITVTNFDECEQNELEGVAKIGREFDTIIKIHDYYFDDVEMYGTVTVKNSNVIPQGYYFEYPRRADVHIVSDVTVDLSNWINDYCYIPYDNNYTDFYINDVEHSIVMGSNESEERLIIEEIIGMNDTGLIFKGKIDRYAFESDEADIYFFATSFEKLVNLRSYENGKVKVNVGYPEREIFF